MKASAQTPSSANSSENLSRVSFAPNLQQLSDLADADVRYLAAGSGTSLFIRTDGATFRIEGSPPPAPGKIQQGHPSDSLRPAEDRAAASAAIGENLLAGVSHDFNGSDASLFLTGVPHFENVRVPEVLLVAGRLTKDGSISIEKMYELPMER